MASIGTLSLSLAANTGQFQQKLQQASKAARDLGAVVSSTVYTAGKLNSLQLNRDLPQQLRNATQELDALQATTTAATASILTVESALSVASSAATVAASGLAVAGNSVTLLGTAAAGAASGLSTALVNVIGLRRAVQTLGTFAGLAAEGVAALLMPLRLVGSAAAYAAKSMAVLLLPFRLMAAAVGTVGRVFLAVISPMLGMAGAAVKLFIAFKAFQVQAKILRAIMDMLPPKLKLVAGALIGVGAASRTASAALSSLGAVGKAASVALSTLVFPIRALLRPISTLTAAVGLLQRTVVGLVKSALNPARLAFNALFAGAAIGGMLKLAADAETLQLQMEVLTKDAGKAREVIQQLNQFANETPFSKMDIKEAARQLLAAQTPTAELIGDLRMLGNIAAGTEVPLTELSDIFARMRVTGRVTMQEINMLQGRGIDITGALRQQFKNLKAAMDDGQVGFENVRTALLTLTTEGGTFAGMIEKLRGSLSGQFSRLKNNILIAATALGEQMLPTVKAILQQVNDFVEGFAQVEDKAGTIAGVLSAAFDVAIESMKVKFLEFLAWSKTAAKQFGGQAATEIGIGALGGLLPAGALKGFRGFMAGGNAAAETPGAALEQAKGKLASLIDSIAAKAPAPLPALATPAGASMQAATPVVTGALQSMLERVRVKGDEIGWGVRGMLDRAKIRVGAAENMLGNWLGSVPVPAADDETRQQRESRTAGAMQRGSAEAFSAIVQAMGQKDPQVAHIDQMRKAVVAELQKLNKKKPIEIEEAGAV